MNTHKQTSEGYNGIYLERSAVDARALVEKLVAEPEMPLDETEMTEARQFERAINNYELREGVTLADVLRQHKSEDVTAPFFFAEAFIHGDVSHEGIALPTFTSSDDVYRWIATSVRDKTLTSQVLQELSTTSTNVYKQTMIEALTSGQQPPAEQFDCQSIVTNPERFIQSAADIQTVRAYLLGLRGQYKRDAVAVDGAKRATVDMYLAKTNSFLAADIPVANYLRNQSQLVSDSETSAVASEIIPRGLRSALNTPKSREATFKRLDFLRNGLGVDATGHASVVSSEVQSVASLEAEDAVFTKAEMKKLQSVMVEPVTMLHIFENIIASASLLSSEPAEMWSKERTHRAADELFQVVINPTKATFNVEGRSGAFKVPPMPRSLYDVLVVGTHELTHINQAQASEALKADLMIADVKGRRISMLSEAGANMEQRMAERKLFGASKPVAMTYARALQSLETDGTMFDAVKAFYDEKRRAFPEISPAAAADEASDRVLRLVRSGGLSSQPMVYAEESILMSELETASPDVRARATAITGIDLVDQVRLHRFGLLPEIKAQSIDWMQLVVAELQPYIDEALAATNDEV